MTRGFNRYATALGALVMLGVSIQGCGSTTSTGTQAAQPSTTTTTALVAQPSTAPSGPASQPSATTSSAAGTVASAAAVQLASYQENSQAQPSDPLALAFQKALNALKPICRESSDRVAAESWASWKDLLKNNRNVPLLQVVHDLQRLGGGLSSNARPTDCAALLAAYLVQVESR